MGLARSTVGFLVREHKRSPFRGPALLLGKQHVYVTMSELVLLMRAYSLDPHPLPPEIPNRTDMPNWTYGWNRHFISDQALFWVLAGIELRTLDVSAYEGCNYVHDLNTALPESLRNQFGLVVDGGTCEHVFDVKTSLQCVATLASTDRGRIIHISQASNWINHGFYQFSPTLFYDYYSSNQFENLECYVSFQGVKDVTRNHWRWYSWRVSRTAPSYTFSSHCGIAFTATKTNKSTAEVIPKQGHAGKVLPYSIPGKTPFWKRSLPGWLQVPLRRMLWRRYYIGRF